jgi:YggT family protein
MTTDLLRYILQFTVVLIDLYLWIVIGCVIMSWLINFGILNLRNPLVRSIYEALLAVTEPVLRPIRRMLPDLGGIDISPIVVVLACQFVQGLIASVLLPNVGKLV